MVGEYEVLLWILLILSSLTDLARGKIYNWITFPAMGSGLLIRFTTHGTSSLSTASLALLVAFLIYFPLFWMGVFSAGDVKLLMAIGAWSGVSLVLHLGLYSIVIGAIVGLVIMLKHRGLSKSLKSIRERLSPSPVTTTDFRMPFAPALLCSFILIKLFERYQWSVL